MRTDSPQTVRLDEYTPYPFEIEHVRLDFTLQPEATRVRSRLKVTRKANMAQTDMVLDGEQLTLKSLYLDGRPLDKTSYQTDETSLTLIAPPDEFTLDIDVEINPKANTALSGLYISGDRFCTQCEAIGFRRITYWPDRPDVMSRFSVSLTADKTAYPVLLSNGSLIESGTAEGPDTNQHYALWDDPHKKPSYLFALCAGDYDIYRDAFTTKSGRHVELAIYVDKGEAPRAAWAMDCLKRAMTWDEDTFGREYDLDVFNIVAVRDFNFGAMENKGLNIFNSAYVLADEATATDADFEAIESIVAHEYFHNWTGNRITCRDWFQLCLKEGLTVFRDQEFSADMRSRSVQRIKDVIRLRARQFPEDAGPLAHPVRPSAYGSIDNLYTATVYEKGAELIRMLKQLIGHEAFAKGMDIYFERHDGDAATIEDFYACFETASGQGLSDFLRWYAQAGTPVVTITEDWNEAVSTLQVTFTQSTPATPNQDTKHPVPIPLGVALLSSQGDDPVTEPLSLNASSMTYKFTSSETSSRPMVSVGRGFSAPVRFERNMTQAEQLQLARAETDPFNRWDLIQGLLKTQILGATYDDAPENPDLIAALAKAAIQAAETDDAYASLLLRLPDVGEIFLDHIPADPVKLTATRNAMKTALADELSDFIRAILARPTPAPFQPSAEQAGIRALRGAAMDLAACDPQLAELLPALFQSASSMTEQLTALGALTRSAKGGENALIAFYNQWQNSPLVIDKWFQVQARSSDISHIYALQAHPDFDLGNPNRVRALAAVFAMGNLAAFHAPDGTGYTFLSELIVDIDPRNPALAARLLTAFEQWTSLEPVAKASAEKTLKNLENVQLSKNTSDILNRVLG